MYVGLIYITLCKVHGDYVISIMMSHVIVLQYLHEFFNLYVH